MNTLPGVPSLEKDKNLLIYGSSNKVLDNPYKVES